MEVMFPRPSRTKKQMMLMMTPELLFQWSLIVSCEFAYKIDQAAGVQADGEAQLSVGDAEEDIWAYNPQGELWTKGGVPADESESEGEKEGSGNDYEGGADNSGDE
ncbi:hypothetical protein K438DRAFT_1967321 [Mycena galopus ATCC 62051]|nr:hypothetical protein K438DRAFT_1967321 [Mycena galopus ATCC 62051]